ncbi:hypothetical protein [Macrococcus psychrotolerans]|uniref:Uncharacterized protein n=1 Tax=Macrococcus psychrotolerans TaxID=3039389 RepID=A0AAU6RFQ6_9STAP
MIAAEVQLTLSFFMFSLIVYIALMLVNGAVPVFTLTGFGLILNAKITAYHQF